MADTTTTNYAFVKPEIAASDDTWGDKNNTNWDDIDAIAADFETRIAAVEAATGSLTASALLTMLLTVDGTGSALDADLLDGQHGAYYLPSASYTAADVLAKLLTVDGTGSGLDADLLDGQSSAYYATAAALAGYQPLDADLTAIAALTTTAYGRGLLELANVAALAATLPYAYSTAAEGQALTLPGGVIVQWGTGTTGAGGFAAAVNLPMAFTDTSKCAIIVTPSTSAGSTNLDGNRTYGTIASTTTYQLGCDDQATSVFWLAIGV